MMNINLTQFTIEHPWLTVFMFWIAGWVVTSPFRFTFLAWNRYLRSKNIAQHGWPTAPVDADGDIVHPSKDD